MSKTQQIELAKIDTERLQTRAALNRATVKDYANAAHGLRRTAADKRIAVMLAYKYRLELDLGEVPSVNAVAKRVGVSHIVMGHQLDTVPSWRDAQARTGTDGKTYSLQSKSSSLRLPDLRPQYSVHRSKLIAIPTVVHRRRNALFNLHPLAFILSSAPPSPTARRRYDGPPHE